MRFCKKIYKTIGIVFLLLLLSGLVFSVASLGIYLATKNTVLTLLLILLSIISFVVAVIIGQRKAKAIPKHKVRVTVLGKRQIFVPSENSQPFGDPFIDCFTFEFPDGSSEEIVVPTSYARPRGLFNLTAINDMGIFTYEENESKKCFIRFERDD